VEQDTGPNEIRNEIEDGGARQDPGRSETGPDGLSEDGAYPVAEASRGGVARELVSKRDATSWLNWQAALYAFILGMMCVFLVPLTSLWWLVPVLGAAVPIALAVLHNPNLRLEGRDDNKAKERELLHALAEQGAITPATAAMRTSLTVDEASKTLEELARKGHLELRMEDGVMAYALRERDRRELPGGDSAPSVEETGDARAPRRLEDPLSKRELEVLSLLASGRTNSEVARDLYVSVGTVKSHTGNIYRKLGAKNRAEAVALARDFELLL
jgi:DNA-binding CsgD family transcriptional regulator